MNPLLAAASASPPPGTVGAPLRHFSRRDGWRNPAARRSSRAKRR